jgi:hypothetical protein
MQREENVNKAILLRITDENELYLHFRHGFENEWLAGQDVAVVTDETGVTYFPNFIQLI